MERKEEIREAPLLEVKGLSVIFKQYEGLFRQTELAGIRQLDVTVKKGEITAVIGSSGSGKSLLAHAILGLLPYNAASKGEIFFQGSLLTEKRKKEVRGKDIVLVPQSVSYLDPLMKVGDQVKNGRQGQEWKEKERQSLNRYGLGEEVEKLYPFELSGGMARRVLIATAVMENPKLVIADEPTPGLHIEAARRVLSHFREIADEGAGVLLITHDLQLALETADSVAVLYGGTTIEEGKAGDFKKEETLRHPYTKALYRAMPEHGFHRKAGNQPYAKEHIEGCLYRPRCPMAGEECRKPVPRREVRGGCVRCIKAQ